MARSRTIKPGFFVNEHLAACEPLARLLFAGLWCLADKEGKLEDRPARIKANVLPYDNCDVDRLLDQLHHSGFVLRYSVGPVRVIQVENWTKHARCHPDEACDNLPDPPQGTTREQINLIVPCALTLTSNLNSNSTPPTPPLGGDATATATVEPNGQTRTRKRDDPAPGFDDFWEAYPRKDAKIRAISAWNKIRPDETLLATMIAAIEVQKQSRMWRREDGEFIPMPATWLNGRYWENKGVKVQRESPEERIRRIIEGQG